VGTNSYAYFAHESNRDGANGDVIGGFWWFGQDKLVGSDSIVTSNVEGN
jgi:hypothetical protein